MPDRVSSMMWNRESGPPWHGKGTPVNGLATAADCIKAAGLDWAVTKIPLRLSDTGALPVPDVMATVRTDLPLTDRRRILGVVGEEYRPLQNWEAFGFFDDVVGAGAAIYETAGAIDDGRRVWLLAKLPDVVTVTRDDVIEPYVLLANGHDGKLMVHVKFTPIRVVCQNTLAMALVGQETRHVAVRHDRNLRRRLEEGREVLGLVKSTVARAENLWRRMAERRLTFQDAEKYFRSVFGESRVMDEEAESGEAGDLFEAPEPQRAVASPRRALSGLKQKALDNFDGKENKQLGIQGTVWAAYNAAVWAIDFQRQTRRDPVDDLCLADGARLKDRALQRAQLLLDVR